MPRLILFAVLALIFGTCLSASAADFYVVSHPSVSLSPEEVRDVYLGEKQFAGSTKLTPVDNAAAQKDFLERMLKMDAVKYANLWTKKGFRDGLNAPAVMGSDAEVVNFVRSTPGAVGYTTGSTRPENAAEALARIVRGLRLTYASHRQSEFSSRD